MLKNCIIAFTLAGVIPLAGCVSLGMSQQASETAYTAGAGISDGLIVSGEVSPKTVGSICTGDSLSYGIVTATRNKADGVNYAPADNAHGKLQSDGKPLNAACVPPPSFVLIPPTTSSK